VVLENRLNPRQASKETLIAALYGFSQLPGSGSGSVSRSDYFPGKKDNMVSVGQSELPGQARVEGLGGQGLLNTYYTTEDLNTDYVRYDHTTKTLREPSGNE
jgi:hypothetical protein